MDLCLVGYVFEVIVLSGMDEIEVDGSCDVGL